jgi:hypothetical protein
MKKPTLKVDFNNMLEPDLVLLPQIDEVIEIDGIALTLHEGMEVAIYDDDINAMGAKDNLVATGVIEKNEPMHSWSKHAKWRCRIDAIGILHESDLLK